MERHELKNITDSLEEIKRSQQAIQMALAGDANLGVKGLVAVVAEHTTYIESDRKLKYKLTGGAIVVTAIYGIITKGKDFFDVIRFFVL